jgi:hypothetical protein
LTHAKAICWTSKVNDKQVFVLVKGGMQGSTKKSKIRPPICKHSFLINFKAIYDRLGLKNLNDQKSNELTYYDAKLLAIDYKKAQDEFFIVYNSWLKIDKEKYYRFNV